MEEIFCTHFDLAVYEVVMALPPGMSHSGNHLRYSRQGLALPTRSEKLMWLKNRTCVVSCVYLCMCAHACACVCMCLCIHIHVRCTCAARV